MFVFRKFWRALLSWNTRFEIRPFALLPTKYSITGSKLLAIFIFKCWHVRKIHAEFSYFFDGETVSEWTVISEVATGGVLLLTLTCDIFSFIKNTFYEVITLTEQFPSSLLKKRLWHKYFPVNFAKFSRKPFFHACFFTEHLRWLPLSFIRTDFLISSITRFQHKNYFL